MKVKNNKKDNKDTSKNPIEKVNSPKPAKRKTDFSLDSEKGKDNGGNT